MQIFLLISIYYKDISNFQTFPRVAWKSGNLSKLPETLFRKWLEIIHNPLFLLSLHGNTFLETPETVLRIIFLILRRAGGELPHAQGKVAVRHVQPFLTGAALGDAEHQAFLLPEAAGHRFPGGAAPGTAIRRAIPAAA